jgi:tetratricopeptide (TPR) repeat protein
LPLALELAAVWLRTLSCREIAQEIEHNLDFLSSSARDIPPRHHSIRAVFDSSWHLLSTKEQKVLMRLSVFRGGFTRDAAEHVCAASLPILAALVSKSLVRHNRDDRYDLHELIRQYAQGWLIRSGDFEDARNQHLKFFLALVEEARQKVCGAEQIFWLDRLEQDHDNLRAALEWALRFEDAGPKVSMDRGAPAVKDALRLAGELYFFWKRRSHWAEGREWLQRALAQCTCSPSTPERLIALNAEALLAVEQADTKSASEYAQDNLRLSQKVGDPHRIATAFNTLGSVRWKQKKHTEARSLCEQGLALFRELDDRSSIAESLHSLGHITINQGELEAAQSYLTESLLIAQELECKIGYVEALGDLGLVAYLRRDYAVAQSRLEESLRLFQEANLLSGVVSTLNRLGDLARCQGDYEKADRLYQEGFSLYREMGDLDEIPSMLHNLGYIARHRGEPLKALSLFREALSIQNKMGNRAGIAECLMGIAGVLTDQRQVETGARLLGAAEALRVSAGVSLWPANCLEYDCILACLKKSLDEQALAAAWAEGQSLNLEQAIAEATI